MDKETIAALRELIGAEPIAIGEAEKRYAESGMPGVTYYDTLADLCSDVDCGIIISPDGLVSCAGHDHAEPARPEPAKPASPKPAPVAVTAERPVGTQIDELRLNFIKRINQNAVSGGWAMLTDKSALEVTRLLGITDSLASWGFADVRALMAWLMKPHGFKVVVVDKQGKKSERMAFSIEPISGACKSGREEKNNKKCGTQASTPAPTPSPDKSVKKLSRYMLTHFACFPDGLQKLSEEIAACAVPDDWFVIDDPADRPMRLIDFKLQLAFAMAVHRMKMEQPSALTLGYDWATFDTGFLTADGRHVVARFELNLEKSDKRLQNYVYTGIQIK